MYINESRTPRGIGILPLQHQGHLNQSYALDMRVNLIATRVQGRRTAAGQLGEYVYDAETVGDVTQWMHFPRNDREISAWSECFPTITHDQNGLFAESQTSAGGGAPPIATGGGSSAPNSLTSSHMLPVFTPEGFGVYPSNASLMDPWSPDRSFSSIQLTEPMRGEKKMWPKFPKEFFGLGVVGTNTNTQKSYYLPVDPRMVAVQTAGDAEMGSLVVDLTSDFKVDLDRMARMQAMMWVIKKPTGCLPFGGQNSLAWNLNSSGQGDVCGGLVIDRPFALEKTSTQDPQSRVIAAASWNYGGPFDVGHPGDQHTLGTDADGRPIHELHLSTHARFRMNSGMDGPIQFMPYSEGGDGDEPVTAYIGYAPHGHFDPCLGSRVGKWVLWSYKDTYTPTTGFPTWMPPPGGGDGPGGDPPGKGGDNGPPGAGNGGGGFKGGGGGGPWGNPHTAVPLGNQLIPGFGGDGGLLPSVPFPIFPAAPAAPGDKKGSKLPIWAGSGLGRDGWGGDKPSGGFIPNGGGTGSVWTGSGWTKDWGPTPKPGEKSGLEKAYEELEKESKDKEGELKNGLDDATSGMSTEKLWRMLMAMQEEALRLTNILTGGGTHVKDSFSDSEEEEIERGAGGRKPPKRGQATEKEIEDWYILEINRRLLALRKIIQMLGIKIQDQSGESVQTIQAALTPKVQTWQPGNAPQPYTASLRPLGAPALLGRPQRISSEEIDTRNSRVVPKSYKKWVDGVAPVTARMEAFGKQSETGVYWGYTQTPTYSKFPGGTAPGGFLVMPPEVDMVDHSTSFAPDPITKSTTYFGTLAGTYFASGLPDVTTGSFKTAHRWSEDSTGNLLFEQLNSSGTAANALKLTSDNLVQIPVGASSFANAIGTIGRNFTSTGTDADTSEKTLATVTLPANALNADGKGVRIKAFGTTAANANTKTIRLKFGTDVLITNDVTTAPNNQDWECDATVFRASASNQICAVDMLVGAVPQTKDYNEPRQTDTAAIDIKLTGQNGTATANDIVCKGLWVEMVT